MQALNIIGGSFCGYPAGRRVRGADNIKRGREGGPEILVPSDGTSKGKGLTPTTHNEIHAQIIVQTPFC